MWRFLGASFRLDRVSCKVWSGKYFPGWIGIKSRIGRPKIHMAGDSRVSLSGVLRYCRMARWKESVSRQPSGPVLSVIIHLIVFTPFSALLLLWGNATDESRWWTPQLCKNVDVAVDVNSGPPSDDSSSLMPNVVNICLSLLMRPLEPSCALSTFSQSLYRSMITK